MLQALFQFFNLQPFLLISVQSNMTALQFMCVAKFNVNNAEYNY